MFDPFIIMIGGGVVSGIKLHAMNVMNATRGVANATRAITRAMANATRAIANVSADAGADVRVQG